MKSFFSFIVVTFIFSSYLVGQQLGANIAFEKESHDFGVIKEEKGVVTATFSFINTGSEPLIINNVKASCGCTAPDWSKTPVLPGQKGFVTATYNPEGRPGAFEKGVSVSSNSTESPTKMLIIKGEVTPKPASIIDSYPREMGEIRLKSNHIGIGKIYKDETKKSEVELINVSSKPVKITFGNVPPYISLSIVPEVINPNQEAKIIATYDGAMIKEWGFIINRISINIDGKTSENNKITISADISENFSKMSLEERANAPKIVFENEKYDFGTIAQESTIEYKYKFTNLGKKTLIIRDIKSTCGCTVANPDKKELEPGESSFIKATFSAEKRDGAQSKIITLITNDPDKSTVRLYISGIVSKK